MKARVIYEGCKQFIYEKDKEVLEGEKGEEKNIFEQTEY